MLSSDYQNGIPDCVFLKLHGELIANGQILLKLTIRFGECQLAVPNVGILQVNYNSCHVKAFFEIQPEDICPVDLTTTNIVKSKIVKFADFKDEENRKDWQIFIEEHLTKPLSQAKFSYEQQSNSSK